MLSHVAYYAYKCQYCDRPSKRMSDLRKHEKGCRVAKDKQEEKEGENEVKALEVVPCTLGNPPLTSCLVLLNGFWRSILFF
jgi:hypothetical protein